MIKRYIFNKSKLNSIIFIHGFYANSGFWLKYFSLFKEFKIILFDIDYNEILDLGLNKNDLMKSLNFQQESNNVVAIISHSLGSVISDIWFRDEKYYKYNICPITFAKRSNPIKFINYVYDKLKQDVETIGKKMDLIDNLLFELRNDFNYSGINYLPNNDEYFNYTIITERCIEFEGNHFDIENALSQILNQLNIEFN
ncbi:MAG TPA: hypothetical protein VJA82_07210 [Sediminibacterium sp.]|uniref:hypothetical protein n=1 Tax=Sediminibacterium sp. TaxID=1917865 RepID=UPI0008C4A9D8|nr:hypothetical protein [Sediminibacterium sp.]OHC84545.1 MAG: hypothetical protein A2472_11330 [Sphingobacteriia bacterium RIFOXYC2_FULL_35_18]OHC89057.1 MAG: hypothetical protein A2546_09200 [Sphingobacteriia bacterium RIFOXYD2_FULL_35_12]HLD53073.1 hypothetical protein [Sediminibacterium sp.]